MVEMCEKRAKMLHVNSKPAGSFFTFRSEANGTLHLNADTAVRGRGRAD